MRWTCASGWRNFSRSARPDQGPIYGPPLQLAQDARRLDISPAWLMRVGTVSALELLREVGIGAIHRHNLALANALRGRLGLPPGDSAIVTVDVRGLERLRAADISASVRAGGPCACRFMFTIPKPM